MSVIFTLLKYLLAPPLFLILWIFISWLLASRGWLALAKKYKLRGRFKGHNLGITSIKVNRISYSNTVRMKIDDNGLYLRQLIPFRVFHPPLFIPWNAVSGIQEHDASASYRVLKIGSPLIATLTIREHDFRQIPIEVRWKMGKEQ